MNLGSRRSARAAFTLPSASQAASSLNSLRRPGRRRASPPSRRRSVGGASPSIQTCCESAFAGVGRDQEFALLRALCRKRGSPAILSLMLQDSSLVSRVVMIARPDSDRQNELQTLHLAMSSLLVGARSSPKPGPVSRTRLHAKRNRRTRGRFWQEASGGIMPRNCYVGGCACGAVRYRLEGEPQVVGLSHCTDCRKETGAPFCTMPIGPSRPSRSRAHSRRGVDVAFVPPAVRRLFHLGEATVEIAIGSLDAAPSELIPTREGWIKRREHWQLRWRERVNSKRMYSDRRYILTGAVVALVSRESWRRSLLASKERSTSYSGRRRRRRRRSAPPRRLDTRWRA